MRSKLHGFALQCVLKNIYFILIAAECISLCSVRMRFRNKRNRFYFCICKIRLLTLKKNVVFTQAFSGSGKKLLSYCHLFRFIFAAILTLVFKCCKQNKKICDTILQTKTIRSVVMRTQLFVRCNQKRNLLLKRLVGGQLYIICNILCIGQPTIDFTITWSQGTQCNAASLHCSFSSSHEQSDTFLDSPQRKQVNEVIQLHVTETRFFKRRYSRKRNYEACTYHLTLSHRLRF